MFRSGNPPPFWFATNASVLKPSGCDQLTRFVRTKRVHKINSFRTRITYLKNSKRKTPINERDKNNNFYFDKRDKNINFYFAPIYFTGRNLDKSYHRVFVTSRHWRPSTRNVVFKWLILIMNDFKLKNWEMC